METLHLARQGVRRVAEIERNSCTNRQNASAFLCYTSEWRSQGEISRACNGAMIWSKRGFGEESRVFFRVLLYPKNARRFS
jgi:hypothetical protein